MVNQRKQPCQQKHNNWRRLEVLIDVSDVPVYVESVLDPT